MNPRGADVCEHCGAELAHQPRTPRIEVAATTLVEAVETPMNDADLAGMGYRAALQWAAGSDGRLLVDRLKRIARARGYGEGWISHCRGRQWEVVWQRTLRWREQQRKREMSR
jgi:hypothetical protein